MIRVLIDYLGDSIELPAGETIVGRDLSCQIRLNHPSVSRRHARFEVSVDRVLVIDLGSRNGTKINGKALKEATELHNGDEVQLGNRALKVKVINAASRSSRTEIPDVDEVPSAEEPTGESIIGVLASLAERVPDEIAPPHVAVHNCPSCRKEVSITADACPHCAYQWDENRPHAVTRVVTVSSAIAMLASESVRGIDRRAAPRLPINVAVIYTSESLSFEAMARDLSRTGMFIATELLEPIGTQCRITVLLDGAPAMAFAAVVCRVVETPTDGSPPGLGTQFVAMSTDGLRWLSLLLERIAPSGDYPEPDTSPRIVVPPPDTEPPDKL